MNEPKFTKGGWFFDEYTRSIRSEDNLRNKNCRKFVIFRIPMRTDKYPISHDEYIANCYLCAAAPDLYAELEEVELLIKKYNSELISSDKFLNEILYFYRNRTFALAKARGEIK